MAIKIGLIGAGGITAVHIKGYLRIPEKARVTAVADVVEEAAQKRAQEVGGASVFSDYNDMLARADIDAVDICLPHHLHKDAIIAAANAKKHIICEKPLCLSIEEADAVQQAVSANGVTLMCAHNQLFIPAVQRAKQLMDEGLIGKVYEVRTTDSFYNNFKLENMGWRARKEFIGGGELIDTGYHPTYLLLYLAGSKPVEVNAMLSKHRLQIMDGEDSAQVLVRFENGIVGNIVTSWAYQSTPTTDKFTIVGEKGHMYSDGGDLHYKIYGSEPQTIPLTPVDTFAAETEDFAERLLEQKRPIHTQVEGIQVLHIILGAYQAANEKRTISF
ncbi:MAG TPA: Gfo/Idh/MocA family oxidoreductase [Ktedonobacteraceae bacterium]|nr:Gfo/Idh/MocA family oxidoreductase [Ktedonobacteraceae bacterium]